MNSCCAVPNPPAKSMNICLNTASSADTTSDRIIPRSKIIILMAVTEMNSKQEIDTLVEVLKEME